MAGSGIFRATFLSLCMVMSVPAQRAGTGQGHGANNAEQTTTTSRQHSTTTSHNSAAVTHTAPPTVSRASGPNLGGQPYPIRNDIAPPTGLIPPAAAYTGISPNGLRTVGGHSRRSSSSAFGGVYPYYGGGYGSGFDLPPVDPAADQAYAADPGTSQLAAAQDAMAEQIRQLSADLQNLKSSPNPAPASPAESAAAAPAPEQAPIQVILRSGERLTVKSYAVMSGVLWDFSGQRVRKVPVSNIDIPASTKATEAVGGDFPQLSAQ